MTDAPDTKGWCARGVVKWNREEKRREEKRREEKRREERERERERPKLIQSRCCCYSDYRNIIQLQTPSKTFMLSAPSMEDKGAWMRMFEEAQTNEFDLEAGKMVIRLEKKKTTKTNDAE
jgi:hypothetical protein